MLVNDSTRGVKALEHTHWWGEMHPGVGSVNVRRIVRNNPMGCRWVKAGGILCRGGWSVGSLLTKRAEQHLEHMVSKSAGPQWMQWPGLWAHWRAECSGYVAEVVPCWQPCSWGKEGAKEQPTGTVKSETMKDLKCYEIYKPTSKPATEVDTCACACIHKCVCMCAGIKPLVQGTALLHTQQFVSFPHDSVLPQDDAGEHHMLYFHMWKLFQMKMWCDVVEHMYPVHKDELCTTG